jgi:hypothetical protein
MELSEMDQAVKSKYQIEAFRRAIEYETYAVQHLNAKGLLLRKEFADTCGDYIAHEGPRVRKDRENAAYDAFNEFFMLFHKAYCLCNSNDCDKFLAGDEATIDLEFWGIGRNDVFDVVCKAMETL